VGGGVWDGDIPRDRQQGKNEGGVNQERGSRKWRDRPLWNKGQAERGEKRNPKGEGGFFPKKGEANKVGGWHNIGGDGASPTFKTKRRWVCNATAGPKKNRNGRQEISFVVRLPFKERGSKNRERGRIKKSGQRKELESTPWRPCVLGTGGREIAGPGKRTKV